MTIPIARTESGAACVPRHLILFVDFDGTLHPLWETHKDARGRELTRPYSGPWLVHAPMLAEMLVPYGERIEIVISSWWAYDRSIDDIRALLPSALAARVVDCIWLSELITDTPSEYLSANASRHACIAAWMERRRPSWSGPWLALDDDNRDWPERDAAHLVLADGTLGNAVVQSELAARLMALLGSRDEADALGPVRRRR